jgi:6-phosphogluconolactonase
MTIAFSIQFILPSRRSPSIINDMKFLLALLLLAGASAWAEPVRFYLGTYTGPLSHGIYTGTLDTSTGQLSPLELAAKARNPSFLALSPDEKFLYAVTANSGGTVASYRKEAGGQLTPLNEVTSAGEGCHVAVDATGHTVFMANYDVGNVSAFWTKPDGSFDRRTAFFQLTGSGPDHDRQTQAHLHSMYIDAQNRHVYACDLGTDHIWIYDFDASTGVLTPGHPASASVPPGSGARHLAFTPDQKFAYVNGEMGLNVTAFERNSETGALTPIQTVPTVPADASKKGVSTAEIFCHPNGKWLYVSNRGAGTITVYAIGEDGKLTWLQNAAAQVKVPRGFGIDPTGKWLIAGGQSDNKIAVLKIDGATGKLTATDQVATVGAPVCVIFEAIAK